MVLKRFFTVPGTQTVLIGSKGRNNILFIIFIFKFILINIWINLEYPGFFENSDSTLLRTESIVMFLPINPDSKVTITRPLPKILGVPDNATTIPPVFSVIIK